jgi:hypothetical protein
MNEQKKYYPEFFDPAEILKDWFETVSALDRGIDDGGGKLDSDFKEYLYIKLITAVEHIDEAFEKTENGLELKPYNELRQVFESLFEGLEKLTDSRVIHISPDSFDFLLDEMMFKNQTTMHACYGMYCIDKGLKAYFSNDIETSSKAIGYGTDAISTVNLLKILLHCNHTTIDLSSKGGRAKAAKYQPLKDIVKKMANANSYKSRRNAANLITPKVLEEGLKLSPPVVLSELQAELTVTKWLKEMGLPANIVR